MISLSSHLSSIPTPNILDQVRKKERAKGFIIFQFWFSILSRLIWIVLNTCILKKIHNEGCSYMSWFYQFGEQFGSITISPKHYIEKNKVARRYTWCMCAKSLQSCSNLWDPMNCSPPGISVHGILQAGILDWLPCPPLGDLPNAGIQPTSLMSPALAGRFFTTSTTQETDTLGLILF